MHIPLRIGGRISRAEWWVTLLTFVLVVATLAVFAGLYRTAVEPTVPADVNIGLGLLVLVALVAWLLIFCLAIIKRLHDRDKSGLWALVFVLGPIALAALAGYGSTIAPQSYVPVAVVVAALANLIWTIIALGVPPGTAGTNRFGPDPLAGKKGRSWVDFLFETRGRLSRGMWWIANVVYLFIMLFGLLVGYTIGVIVGDIHAEPAISVIGLDWLFSLIAWFVFLNLASIRRLHDRGRSGWWTLLLIVAPAVLAGLAILAATVGPGAALALPLAIAAAAIFLWALIELGALRGACGDNRYGPSPAAGPIMRYFFDPRGRVNRAKWWPPYLGISAAIIAVVFMGDKTPAVTGYIQLYLVMLSAFFMPSMLIIGIKRMHDRNRSGWWAFLYLVAPLMIGLVLPLVGALGANVTQLLNAAVSGLEFGAVAEMGMRRGTSGDNRYGPDPLARRTDAASAEQTDPATA